MSYQFPGSDLDDIDVLMSLLGSFWANTYQGEAVVSAYVQAKAATAAQTHLDLLELAASASRKGLRVFHKENWKPLTLSAAAANSGTYGTRAFDDGGLFDAGEIFDAPAAQPYFAWPLPVGMVDVPLITNRITNPSRTYVQQVDYLLQDGYVIFRDNPFNDPLVARRSVLADNQVVDQEASLWAFRANFDTQSIQTQIGYVVDLELPSSEDYKNLVNAVLDALVGGTTMQQLHAVLTAATGIPLVKNDGEIVQAVIADNDRLLVVTDQRAYQFPAAAVALVSPGDVVDAGQPLTDALVFYELSSGQVPDPSAIPALAVGRGFLAAGFFGDLVFANRNVPLVVTSAVDGFTRVSWELDGWPGDVELFFDVLHARGVASGQTLAHLLDRRPAANRDTEPLAGALPATINPLGFLCQNILRTTTLIVKVKSPAGGTGLNAAKILRKILPAHTALILIAQLAQTDTPIKMDAPGTPEAPGCEEALVAYLGMNQNETLAPGMVGERVRIRLIGGQCV